MMNVEEILGIDGITLEEAAIYFPETLSAKLCCMGYTITKLGNGGFCVKEDNTNDALFEIIDK